MILEIRKKESGDGASPHRQVRVQKAALGWTALLIAAGLGLTLPGIGPDKSLGGALASPFSLFQLGSPEAATRQGPDFGIDDRWNQTFTWSDYALRSSCVGQIPKWNRNELGGFSYFASGSTGALSPFNLVTCHFPQPKRLFASHLIAFCVAACGTFAFLRSAFGVSRPAASAGALAFSLSGVFVAYAFFPHGFTGSWIGLVAISALGVRRAASLRALLVKGSIFTLVVAMCGFTGQPEMFLITTGGGIASAFFPAEGRRSKWAGWIRLGRVAAFSFLGACLAAIQLLPTALYSLSSVIGEERAHDIVSFSALSPHVLFQSTKQGIWQLAQGSLDPAFHGTPGPKETATIPSLPYSRVTVYMGSAALALFLTQILRKRVTARHLRSLLGTYHFKALIGACIAGLIAVRHPLTQIPISRVPILSSLDVSMMRWLYSFFLALFISVCIESVIRSGTLRTFLALFATLNLVFALASLFLSRQVADLETEIATQAWIRVLNQTSLIHWLVFASAMMILILRLRQQTAIALTIALIGLEMTGVQSNLVNRWATVYPVVVAARARLEGVRESGQRIIGVSTPSPTLGTLLDVPMLNGYELMASTHRNLAEAIRSCKGYTLGFVLEFCAHPVLPTEVTAFGNVGWILGPKGIETDNLHPHATLGSYALYRMAGALGEAFFVKGSECKAYKRRTLTDLTTSLKTQEALKLTRNAPEHLRIEFSPSLSKRCLFVSETFDKGWKVKAAPGWEERRITSFAGIWQAVEVMPGDKALILEFLPQGYLTGRLTSLIAIITLLLLLAHAATSQQKDARRATSEAKSVEYWEST